MEVIARRSRRHFIKSALAIPTAGCTLATFSTRTAAQNDGWKPADGVRIAGSTSGLVSLDPALSRDSSANFLLQHLYRGLASLDASLEPTPELAASIDRSADGLRYDVTIRDGARFHDGRQVTPRDVQFSWSRALDPDTGGGDPAALAAATFLGDIEGAADVLAGLTTNLAGIEITGDHTLTITLVAASASFPARLASVTASVLDATQAMDSPDWLAHPNGSGPFRFRTWAPGQELTLDAAETWWAGKPDLASIHARLGISASQPPNLFQAGLIDLMWGVPADLVRLIQDPASGVEYGNLSRAELFATSYVAFGNSIPPLDDLHVRRALQRAFPARSVADAMYNGTVTPATGIVPPGMAGREWRVRHEEVDLGAARRELSLSRYGSAREVPPFQVYAADIRPVEALRDVVNRDLDLRMEAVQVGWVDFLEGLANRRFPAYSVYWNADYPDPESMLDMLFASGSPDNFTGYANPGLDELLGLASEATGESRLAFQEEANRLLIEDVAVIPLYHDVGYAIAREGVAGLRVTPMGLLGLESLVGVA